MGSTIPVIERPRFDATIRALAPVELAPESVERLWTHYLALTRWNPRLSLVGPGTAGEVLARHYGESLAALPLLEPEDRRLVDVGTGAGFPGFVLAACRPDLEVTLCDARQRKWSFLTLICQKTALPCHCLNARVGPVLPEEFPDQVDVLAARAVKFSAPEIAALEKCLNPRGRFLMWTGERVPEVLDSCSTGRRVALSGATNRSIVEVFPSREVS